MAGQVVRLVYLFLMEDVRMGCQGDCGGRVITRFRSMADLIVPLGQVEGWGELEELIRRPPDMERACGGCVCCVCQSSFSSASLVLAAKIGQVEGLVHQRCFGGSTELLPWHQIDWQGNGSARSVKIPLLVEESLGCGSVLGCVSFDPRKMTPKDRDELNRNFPACLVCRSGWKRGGLFVFAKRCGDIGVCHPECVEVGQVVSWSQVPHDAIALVRGCLEGFLGELTERFGRRVAEKPGDQAMRVA